MAGHNFAVVGWSTVSNSIKTKIFQKLKEGLILSRKGTFIRCKGDPNIKNFRIV